MFHGTKNLPVRISPVNVTKFAKTTDLVTFTGEILNGKFHFLCSVCKNETDFLSNTSGQLLLIVLITRV